MALNFPDSPGIGSVFTDTNSGFSYKWDGTVWNGFVGQTPSEIKVLTDISSSFNGTLTTFALAKDGSAVHPVNAQQLRVVLGGVVQAPGVDYTISTNNITFTTAPTAGLDCALTLFGTALSLSTLADGSVTTAKLANGSVTSAKLSTNGLNITGVVTATSFSGDGSALTGVGGTADINAQRITVAGVSTFTGQINANGGVTGTASVATNITVTANNSTDETVYPIFVDGATGSQGAETDTGLSYNPSTGALTATTFSGTATNVTVTANNSTNETVYPIFVDGATGSQGAETDTGLSYNPSTGVLTTTAIGAHSVSGTLTTQVILPDGNGTRDLGATGTRWANLYTSDIDLSNEANEW